jgi:putative glutathione S-transferase
MGMLVDGSWQDTWYPTAKTGGRFRRKAAQYRAQIDSEGEFPPSGRYHLYVSLACPWAHRTLIARKLKGLEEIISVSVVDPLMGSEGWVFSSAPGCTPDPLNGFTHAHQLYTATDPAYTGRVTVPILWDIESAQIVNNESSEILRLFNRAFDAWGDSTLDFFPQAFQEEIEAVNARIYEPVNNGVYKCGFATTQSAYEEACKTLFSALDWLEDRLSRQRYLVSPHPTEADWRLFPTLLRFDPVYHGHFKCNLRRIQDYPNLSGYLRELYQVPGVAQTCDFDHIKRHYYWSHETINPTRIVPLGSQQDLHAPHGRDHLA